MSRDKGAQPSNISILFVYSIEMSQQTVSCGVLNLCNVIHLTGRESKAITRNYIFNTCV